MIALSFLLALTLALTGCASEVAPRGTLSAATIELRHAATATLAQASFRTVISGGTGPAAEVTVTDYQAPDRVREIAMSGRQRVETIVIGSTEFDSLPGKAGWFYRHPTRTWGATSALRPLEVLRSVAGVTERGDEFSFRYHAPPNTTVTGVVTVVRGLVVSETLRYGEGGPWVTYRFTMLGSAPPVEAPPRSRVLTRLPPWVRCVESGAGAVLCVNGSQPSP